MARIVNLHKGASVDLDYVVGMYQEDSSMVIVTKYGNVVVAYSQKSFRKSDDTSDVASIKRMKKAITEDLERLGRLWRDQCFVEWTLLDGDDSAYAGADFSDPAFTVRGWTGELMVWALYHVVGKVQRVSLAIAPPTVGMIPKRTRSGWLWSFPTPDEREQALMAPVSVPDYLSKHEDEEGEIDEELLGFNCS